MNSSDCYRHYKDIFHVNRFYGNIVAGIKQLNFQKNLETLNTVLNILNEVVIHPWLI